MDRDETAAFWQMAWVPEHERELTTAEQAFVQAAVRRTKSRWDGECDVGCMAQLVRQEPTLLETIGPAVVNIASYMRGCAPALEFLLDRGLRFSVAAQRSREGKAGEYDSIHEAAWAGSVDNLRVLFQHGMADPQSTANPHTGWPDHVSLLYWAARAGSNDRRDGVGLTRLLLEHGADPEVRFKGNGERGNTALQEAAVLDKEGKRKIAEVLIEYGAVHDVFSACSLNDLDRVEQLARDTPALARARGEAEMTPLHWAARTGAEKCARWLLRHAAEVDAGTVTGRTPLHLAADGNRPEMVWLPAGQGADLNAQDAKGRTPLHRATYRGCPEAAEVLIVLGADSRIENRSGRTPLEVARKDCLFLRSLHPGASRRGYCREKLACGGVGEHVERTRDTGAV